MIALFEDNNGIIVRGNDHAWLDAGEIVTVVRKETSTGDPKTRWAQVERTERDKGYRSWGGELRAPYDGEWDFMLRWVPEPSPAVPARSVILGQARHYVLAR